MTLDVADSGVGIAPSDITRAFRPFEQIDSTLSRPHEGTGLGLHLSHRLAELHGGTLDIDSTVGEGTTVSVRFPGERVG